MSKVILYFFSIFQFVFYLDANPLQFKTDGQAAILINADNGAILFEQDAHKQLFPASTTKVATALYALKFHQLELHTLIKAESDSLKTYTQESKQKLNYKGIAAYALEPDGTHIAIKKEEILPFKDLLKGMMIASGNDAANVIANALGPTIPTFMDKLNLYLKDIGCKNTHFTNPHGLHDPNHQSTAYDLAIMAKEAMKDPLFSEIVSQVRFTRPKTNKQNPAVFLQTNRLLRSGELYYDKAIGVKTGYHSKSKKTFIGAACSQDRTLILVLLGYQGQQAIFKDAKNIFEMAFNQPKVNRTYVQAGPQRFTKQIPKAANELQTFLKESLNCDYYPSEDPQAKCFLQWNQLSLPIVKNQPVGELYLKDKMGNVLTKAQLFAVNDVALYWPYRWLAYLSNWKVILFFILCGVCGSYFLFRRH